MIVKSLSARTTRLLAGTIGQKLVTGKIKTKPKQALVFGLSGELGAGKTTFIQALAKSLGVKNRLTSPTFLIMRNYKIRKGKFRRLFHVDAYRLKNSQELTALDFKSILKGSSNVVFVEWAEKVKKILPPKTVWLNFRHGRKENERFIKINL